jgi:predicted HTH domain antitoxin
MNNITVTYPAQIKDVFRFSDNSLRSVDVGRELQVLSLVKLFEEGEISAGFGAEILDISRMEFIELLSRHGVDFVDLSTAELEQEVAIAERVMKEVRENARTYAC